MREKQGRILEHAHLHWTAWTERVGSDTRELSRVRSKKTRRREVSLVNNAQTIGMHSDSATHTSAPAGEIRKARHASAPLYNSLAALTVITNSLDRSTDFCLVYAQVFEVMAAAQQFAEEEQRMMNLTRLQSEVSVGTYKFTRPLTIVACATQEKYIVYIACSQCPEGVQRHKQGYYCLVHKWQISPTYRYNLRVLLQDWIGT